MYKTLVGPPMLAIETSGLRKAYGKTEALAGVDLSIEAGSVYGLLGPNGAGKTTAIRILSTLAAPSAGTATILGHDVVREAKAVRRKISLTGQYAAVDEELTGFENLVMVARLLGLPRRDAKERAGSLLETFELSDASKRLVRTYSGGMRRRIDIAASLIARPEILFLDEPTSGLDPRSRNQVWDMVRSISGQGTTVLLTTQYLEEADRLAERLGVIDHGRLIAEGTSQELKASIGKSRLQIRLARKAQKVAAVKILAAASMPLDDPTAVGAQVRDVTHATRLINALTKGGIEVAEFNLGNPSLDDVFFSLTGHPAEGK